MASFAANVTARLWLDYAHGAQRHSVLLRATNAAVASAAAGVFRAVLANNAGCFFTDVYFDGARVSETLSNISVPVPFVPVAGTQTTEAMDLDRSLQHSFVGRDLTGSKTRYTFFGFYTGEGVPVSRRLVPEAESRLAGFMTDWFDAMEEANITSIAGETLIMKQYCNVAFNAYYQRKARG